jgi:hypothetical protein
VVFPGHASPYDRPAVRTIALPGHEAPERRFVRQVPRDLRVIEFGGAIGVTSSGWNRHLNDLAWHTVFEPNPVEQTLPDKNRRINRCRFAIRVAAVGYHGDTVTFGVNENRFMCRLAELGNCAGDIYYGASGYGRVGAEVRSLATTARKPPSPHVKPRFAAPR